MAIVHINPAMCRLKSSRLINAAIYSNSLERFLTPFTSCDFNKTEELKMPCLLRYPLNGYFVCNFSKISSLPASPMALVMAHSMREFIPSSFNLFACAKSESDSQKSPVDASIVFWMRY